MRRLLLLLWLVSAAWEESKAYKPEAFSEQLLQKAESGDAEAQCKLAGAYREGRGVEKNPAESLKWLQRSADAGFGLAQLILAKELIEGVRLRKDPIKAEQLLLSAEKNLAVTPGPHLAKVSYFLGMIYLNMEEQRDLEKARRFLTSAAEKNDSCAQHVLARMYEDGWGVEKNEVLALDYLKKSAADSLSCGKALLGEFYLKHGEYELAREWLEKAAALGEASAALHLGYLYRNGRGTLPDFQRSSDWFEKAVQRGEWKGRYERAKNYKLQGEDAEAIRLFEEISAEPLIQGQMQKNYLVGVASLEAGRFDKALDAFEQADPMAAFAARGLLPATMTRAERGHPATEASVEILDGSMENIGSGVLIGKEGKVLTAAHVVAEKQKLYVRDVYMRVGTVSGLWPGEAGEDLAALQTSLNSEAGVDLATQSPSPGDSIRVIGHPAQVIFPIETRGTVHVLHQNGLRMCAETSSYPGFSGSGVFNASNQLVGIVISTHHHGSSGDGLKDATCIHMVAESLPRIEELVRQAAQTPRMVSVENIPTLKTLGRDWDRKANEDQRSLGLAKNMLEGPPSDKAKAVRTLKEIAGRGNSDAQTLLGLCYRDGFGAGIDPAKAAELFLLAALQGDSCAKHHLGMLYLDGAGVPRDDAKALEWLEKAAQDAPACGKLFLGIYYHRKNDLVNALRWYRVAQEQGDGRAESYLAQIRSHRPEAPKQEIPASP